jgi:hypothetical protein
MLTTAAGLQDRPLRQCCSYVKAGLPFECVVDDAGELAFEAADRFASAFAFGLFAFEVGAGAGVRAGLCDRDPVEGGFELPVSAPGEERSTRRGSSESSGARKCAPHVFSVRSRDPAREL